VKLPLEQLEEIVFQKPDQVFFRWSNEQADGWLTWTRKQVWDEVKLVAHGLRSLGVKSGQHIAIFSRNSPHWVMADFAIWRTGGVTIPIYANASVETFQQIFEHSEARVLFIGSKDLFMKVQTAIPPTVTVICLEERPFINGLLSWKELRDRGRNRDDRLPSRRADEVATIVYTSGTTAKAKGAMHSFGNLAVGGSNIVRVVPFHEEDHFFSYLPLAHVAERLLVEMGSLYAGAHVTFARSLERFARDLKDSQPSVFLAVPRIWQKFQEGILSKIPQKKLDFLLSLPLVSGVTKRRIRNDLGLGKARVILTGAAPVPVDMLRWFARLGVVIQEAYAMTENFCYSHFMYGGDIKFGYSGRPLPQVEVKLSTGGEVLVKSPCRMIGYFKNDEETRDLFEGDYIKTGDLGSVDDTGCLRITGRAKDIFKTAKGKYINPIKIEDRFLQTPLLEQCCVIGSGLDQPVVIGVLKPMTAQGRDQVQSQLRDIISQINRDLEAHERVAKLLLSRQTWTADNGFLTPTMKMKRSIIEKSFFGAAEKAFQNNSTVIFLDI
jgi:long-chain acyl-CoA synthetase